MLIQQDVKQRLQTIEKEIVDITKGVDDDNLSCLNHMKRNLRSMVSRYRLITTSHL